MRRLDGITNLMDVSLSKLQEIMKAREAWCATVHEITKCQDTIQQMNSNDNNSTWHVENIITNKEEVVTNTEEAGDSDQVIFVLVIECNS